MAWERSRDDPRENNVAYRKLKRSMRGMQPCHLCQGNLGPILDDVDYNHPLARTVDHLLPLSEGGELLDPLNCLPAHRHCNNHRKGAAVVSPRSRKW